MAKNTNPKCKICRRVGEKLMLKGDRCKSTKCAMVKRNYPPGFHGSKGRRRITDYGTQLQEKQKAKNAYNLMEKQFKLTFDIAKKHKGDAGENLFKLLEMRLDNVIFRLGMGESRAQARQLVNHGHFLVNKKKVSIPSFRVSENDVIEIRTNKLNNKIFKDIKNKIKKTELPGWINFNESDMTAKILHEPSAQDVKSNINAQMIVEYYSR